MCYVLVLSSCSSKTTAVWDVRISLWCYVWGRKWWCPVSDTQKAKSQLRSSLERLYIKAFTDLTSPEAVAEQSSLTLETARSHKMVRHRLYDAAFMVRHSLNDRVVSYSLCDTVVLHGIPLRNTVLCYLSVVWLCWLDNSKGIWPVKSTATTVPKCFWTRRRVPKSHKLLLLLLPVL